MSVQLHVSKAAVGVGQGSELSPHRANRGGELMGLKIAEEHHSHIFFITCLVGLTCTGLLSQRVFFLFFIFPPKKQIRYDFGFYSFQRLVLFIFINLLMTPKLSPTHYTAGAGNSARHL